MTNRQVISIYKYISVNLQKNIDKIFQYYKEHNGSDFNSITFVFELYYDKINLLDFFYDIEKSPTDAFLDDDNNFKNLTTYIDFNEDKNILINYIDFTCKLPNKKIYNKQDLFEFLILSINEQSEIIHHNPELKNSFLIQYVDIDELILLNKDWSCFSFLNIENTDIIKTVNNLLNIVHKKRKKYSDAEISLIIPQLFDIIAILKNDELTKKVCELFNYFLEEKTEVIVKTKFGYIFKDELFLDFIMKNLNIFTNKKLLDFLRFLSFQNFDYKCQYMLNKNKEFIDVNKLIYEKFEHYYLNIEYNSSKDLYLMPYLDVLKYFKIKFVIKNINTSLSTDSDLKERLINQELNYLLLILMQYRIGTKKYKEIQDKIKTIDDRLENIESNKINILI